MSDRLIPCQLTAEVWDNGLSDEAVAKRGIFGGEEPGNDTRGAHLIQDILQDPVGVVRLREHCLSYSSGDLEGHKVKGGSIYIAHARLAWKCCPSR